MVKASRYAAGVVLLLGMVAPSFATDHSGPNDAWGNPCPGPGVAPYGMCQCTGFGGPVPFCPAAANGGCTCQNPNNIIGCTGDHWCVGSSLQSPVWLTPETKEKIRRLAGVFGATGGLTLGYAKLCALAGPGAPFCFAWLNTAGTLQITVGSVLVIVAAVDPLDPNYTEVVVVVPTTYEPAVAVCRGRETVHKKPWTCDLTPAETDVVNQLFETEAWIAGLGDAMVTTANRASAAAAAGDAAALDRQTAAMRAFQAQLGGLLATDAALRTELTPMLLENRRAWLDAMAQTLEDPVPLLTELSTEVLP